MNPVILEQDINQLAKDLHANNVAVGWWNGDVCMYEKFQLVSTEIAEATEGARKDLMDDHLPHRKMEEVELADTLIRVLDIKERLGIDYVNPDNYVPEVNPEFSVGRLHLSVNFHLLNVVEVYAKFSLTDDEIQRQKDPDYKPMMDSNLLEKAHQLNLEKLTAGMSELIINILAVAAHRGYNIYNAAIEKIEYNKQRPDHKLENRSGEHGKKF